MNRPDSVTTIDQPTRWSCSTAAGLRLPSSSPDHPIPNNPTPVIGDWDGDGVATLGLYDDVSSRFFLADTNARVAMQEIAFGPPGERSLPVAGDWDGDSDDTVALLNQRLGFIARNTNTEGIPDLTFELT
ncbi:MAG: hypothetical protein SFX73_23915 [Kofleriaceae bacterium]|nr:hypothetical protein [Kofleriaceae bacterium]